MEIPPFLIIAVAGLLSVGLILAVSVMWLSERRLRMARVRAAVGRRSGRTSAAVTGLRNERSSAVKDGLLSFMKSSTRGISIMKDRQSREMRQLLVAAGFRSRDAIVVFTFFKLFAPIFFLGAAAIWVYGLDPIGRGPMADIGAVMLAALVGSKVPDLVVKNRRQKRVESVRKALPDTLDMLVICAEAGLASDAALKRVVAETSRTASVLGAELNQTALELGFMPERRQALENLAERVPLPSIQGFVNTMIQAEKYGTPLARAYKVLSQE